MTIFSGDEAKLYTFFEAVYGTGPTTDDMGEISFIQNFDVSENPNLIPVRGCGSRNVITLKRGLLLPTTKINQVCKADFFGWWDYWIQHPEKSYTCEWLFDKAGAYLSLRLNGSKLDRLKVSCVEEDLLRVEADIIAKALVTSGSKASSGAYNPELGNPCAWHETYVKKGGAETERCSAWSFEIKENLKPVAVIRDTNGHVLKYLQRRHREVKGELTYMFEATDEFDDVIADTAFDLEFGFSTTNKATLSGCKWDNVTAPTKMDDLVYLKMPFTAKSVAFAAQ